MLRIAQNLLRWAGFDDEAVAHDHHALSAFGGQRQVVRDQQHRRAQFTGEALQMIENLALHRDVECGGRLVGDEQPGPSGQCDGNQDPLAHAPGQLMRVSLGLGTGVGQPRLGEQLHRSSARITEIVRAQRLSDLESRLPHRVEVGRRILRHVTDAGAADGAHAARIRCGDVETVEKNSAAGDPATRRQEAENCGRSGGLPRPGLADQR